MSVRRVSVPRGEKKKLLVVLAAALPGMPAERVLELLAAGRVVINGKKVTPQRKLFGGEQLEIDLPAPQRLPPVDGPRIALLHEDEHCLIANKPPRVVVERDGRNPSLVELLATQHGGFDVAGFAAPGVVHRLDRDTSGCVVMSKTDVATAMLQSAFEEKRVGKRYLAVVLGEPPDEASLDTAFGRDPEEPRRFTTKVPSARRARLSYRVFERFRGCALLEVTLDTGRTHQIRVQLADAGFPVLMDPVYGTAPARAHPVGLALGRLALHASSLRLTLPSGTVQVNALLPDDFGDALRVARNAVAG